MRFQLSPKIVRKIVAADGYLDLKMPEQAIEELNQIEFAGEMQPAVDFVMGQALMMAEKYTEATDYLQMAAENIPEPFSQSAWMMLSDCFRKNGQIELAEIVDMFAEESAEMVVQNAYAEFGDSDEEYGW